MWHYFYNFFFLEKAKLIAREWSSFLSVKFFPAVFCGVWLLLFSSSIVWAQSSSGNPSPPAGAGSSAGTQGSPQTGGSQTGTPSSASRPSGSGRKKRSSKDYMQSISETDFAAWGKKFYLSVREHLGPFIKRHFRMLSAPFQVLGWLILTFLFLAAIITMARENQSAAGLGGLLIRAVFCSFIVGYSMTIVDQLTATGTFWLPRNAESFQTNVKDAGALNPSDPVPGIISSPSDAEFSSRTSVLTLVLDWRDAQARKYYEGYQALVDHGFKVKVDNSEIWQAYNPDLSFVIPAYDEGGESAMDYARRMNLENWSPANLLALLNGAVIVMNLGILFSTILNVFLLSAFKLLSPVFFAIAIHKKFAQQLTSPFVRGLLVATLLLPTVNIILEGLCYTIACIGFAPFYLKQGGQWAPPVAWDEASVAFVGNMSHLASYVFTAAFLTAISSLCMILSPVIAYKIAQGEMFSSAVGSVSGWTAGLIGIGMSAFSSAVGTLFQREAEHFQNIGAQAQRNADAKASYHMETTNNRIQAVQRKTAALQTVVDASTRSPQDFQTMFTPLLRAEQSLHADILGAPYQALNGSKISLPLLKELTNYYLNPVGQDEPELAKQLGLDKDMFKGMNESQIRQKLAESIMSYSFQAYVSPYARMTEKFHTAKQMSDLNTGVAEWVRAERDKAIDQSMRIRIGGAAANYRYSEIAAEKRALGAYFAGIGQTANEVLMQQIENNHRV